MELLRVLLQTAMVHGILKTVQLIIIMTVNIPMWELHILLKMVWQRRFRSHPSELMYQSTMEKLTGMP